MANPEGVNFLTGAFVKDIGFAPVPRRITVNRLDCERNGAATSVAVAPEDIVLITTGSQAADLSPGSMTEPPNPRPTGRSSYVNNVWLPWRRGDMPPPVPEVATNLGLIGQYVDMPKEIAFTIECSVRSAWEAIRTLLKRGPAPPAVYQGQYDPTAVLAALKVFLS